MIDFFFNDTATTEIYTLSLHDALPILSSSSRWTTTTGTPPTSSPTSCAPVPTAAPTWSACPTTSTTWRTRSEEHTSELQSRQYLVCRLLLEKKKHSNSQHVYPAVAYYG